MKFFDEMFDNSLMKSKKKTNFFFFEHVFLNFLIRRRFALKFWNFRSLQWVNHAEEFKKSVGQLNDSWMSQFPWINCLSMILNSSESGWLAETIK